ncbi:MAG: hypothetical protein GX895_00760 [Clostridiales bacterium]|uniref:hypothetical protein n=1 Tax=Clostridium sp. N3C TaxID=1776758 RepID=UPI00092DF171|nr:hypothetical protein [Clostridium sp. N3C]NLZ47314.1 hypothetical protein [Clostridiales bacterium]SCN21329.1 hypothetical protein N3C_0105 [Clostridium sp. N3C]
MGVGYIIGCFFSILLWKVDRVRFLRRFDELLRKVTKNSKYIEGIYLFTMLIIIIILSFFKYNEILNAITAFLVIDISNAERKVLNINNGLNFYDSISLISRSLVSGFIAPLFYILILGNSAGICYMLIYNLFNIEGYKIIGVLFNILTIIPSGIAQFFLYVVYLLRNKKLRVDFKGDYFINLIKRPLLNIDIFGAYIESVNFYYYFNDNDVRYVKSYGEYGKKIDLVCLKHYLSISYAIAMVYFLTFFILIRYMN